jgi:ATP-dependent protease ClpP protease subunit
MQYEVKIYGDISDKRGENLFTLQDLQEQLLEFKKGESVLVRIKTNGGLVDEGFAIYNELRRFAKEKKVTIITRCDGTVASIGTVIFLAGDKRIVNPYICPFVHNAYGGSKQENLDYINNQIAKFYSENTLMTVDEAKILMENKTFISPDEALKMKFGTELEEVERPAFMMRFTQDNNTKQHIKMNDKTKEGNLLNRIFNLLTGSGIQNKIIFDANNEELEFPELSEEETIIEGAKATYKGQPANGEIVAADGNTYVFENGILKAIKKKIDEEEAAEKRALEEQLNQAQTEIQALKTQLETINQEKANIKNELDKKDQIINKVKALESEFVVDETKEKPKSPKSESKTQNFMKNINEIKL